MSLSPPLNPSSNTDALAIQSTNSLDETHLSNVLYYFPNYIEAQQFMLINKKCKDTFTHIKVCPHYKPPHTLLQYPRNVFTEQKAFIKELDLFRNIEIVDFYGNASQYQLLISKHPKTKIALKTPLLSDELEDLEPSEKSRIIELNYDGDPLNFSLFKNVHRATLWLTNKKHKCSDYFNKKSHRFEYVRIVMESHVDVDFIRSINQYNFGKVIIELVHKDDIEMVVKNSDLLNHIIYCTKHPYTGMDERIIILGNQQQQVTNSPYSLTSINQHELSQLQTIDIDCNNQTIDISLLKNITSLTLINMKIPTTFSFYSLEKLKQLTLIGCTIDDGMSLTNFYPSTLETLCCDAQLLPTESDIKKLTIQNHEGPLNLTNFSLLQELILQECSFGSETTNQLIPPHSLEVLCLDKAQNTVDLDLSSCRNLQEIVVLNCYQIQITLPLYISSLIIAKCRYLALTNVESVHLHDLALCESSCIFFDINKVAEKLDLLVFR
ncbi:Leucine-rich repeat containing protein [Entamoeba marina]